MILLAIRTDNPQAELYLYEDGTCIGQIIWQAHRELSATIHLNIKKLLDDAGKTLPELNGIIFFQGPGSFTGLRMGSSVANSLGASYNIPVVAEQGEEWIPQGLVSIQNESSFKPMEPFYGADANITLPKK